MVKSSAIATELTAKLAPTNSQLFMWQVAQMVERKYCLKRPKELGLSHPTIPPLIHRDASSNLALLHQLLSYNPILSLRSLRPLRFKKL